MTAQILEFCQGSRWTCRCLDCKLFRTAYRRSVRAGFGVGRQGLTVEMNEYGDVLTPLVDEVVVWRLMRGIAVPTASQEERSHAAWFLLQAGEIERAEIAARVGVTTRTVDRLSARCAKDNYVSPLVRSYWFAA